MVDSQYNSFLLGPGSCAGFRAQDFRDKVSYSTRNLHRP